MIVEEFNFVLDFVCFGLLLVVTDFPRCCDTVVFCVCVVFVVAVKRWFLLVTGLLGFGLMMFCCLVFILFGLVWLSVWVCLFVCLVSIWVWLWWWLCACFAGFRVFAIVFVFCLLVSGWFVCLYGGLVLLALFAWF